MKENLDTRQKAPRKPSFNFMLWYAQWYKEIHKDMNIQISLPSIIMPYKENNVVILGVFEKNNDTIDAKTYLNLICQKADELGVTIYLEPIPRMNKLNTEKSKKITRDWLIDYYSKFGFELTTNKVFMKRPPKKVLGGNLTTLNYEIGGI